MAWHSAANSRNFSETLISATVALHQNAKREMTAKVSGQRDFFQGTFKGSSVYFGA
jgi:hypothetical protein